MSKISQKDFHPDQAISPIDGMYRETTAPLANQFSEYALIKTRVEVEVEYLIHFAESNIDKKAPSFNNEKQQKLRNIYENFSLKDAQRIKDIEVRGVPPTEHTKEILKTNHDVKAVEYFVREKLQALGFGSYEEFTHIGLTSQDINNTAVPLSVHRATTVLIPGLESFSENISEIGNISDKVKENLKLEIQTLTEYSPNGKFGGATGGFNALHKAYPEIDWPKFGDSFLQDKLGLERQQATTQIEHYDMLMTHFNTYKRIGVLLRKIAVMMPEEHKEDGDISATTCIGTMIAYIEHFTEKLPVSRHQRDLSDSTVTRNFGVPLGYMMIAIQKIQESFGIENKEDSSSEDLEFSSLTTTGAIDGRYRRGTKSMAKYFSDSSKPKFDWLNVDMGMREDLGHGLRGASKMIEERSLDYRNIAMLAYTHGQAATPTDFGKEFQVFAERLDNISIQRYRAKTLEEKLDLLTNMNTIFLDFSKDIWLYIHLGYLKQKPVAGEVGSSAMPHKVNPIDFENAEGNLGIANALLKYVVRDDVEGKERIIGEAFAYMQIACNSLQRGVGKIDVNRDKISDDLNNNPMILAEAIQTYFKVKGITGAYEQLRDFTRGEEKTLEDLHKLIDGMKELDQKDKKALKITPAEYIGQYPNF